MDQPLNKALNYCERRKTALNILYLHSLLYEFFIYVYEVLTTTA